MTRLPLPILRLLILVELVGVFAAIPSDRGPRACIAGASSETATFVDGRYVVSAPSSNCVRYEP